MHMYFFYYDFTCPFSFAFWDSYRSNGVRRDIIFILPETLLKLTELFLLLPSHLLLVIYSTIDSAESSQCPWSDGCM